jgi:seryl-tRNA synthetase|tara:strand:- start:194 stop:376 length:183 start_codon:yes stop_codon:yes gene_type:complete
MPNTYQILEGNVREMEKQNRELMVRIAELVAEKNAIEKELDKVKKMKSNEYDDQMQKDSD